MNSLNPVLRVSDQLLDAVGAHLPLSEDQRQARIVDLIEMVGIPRVRLTSYPHELSGGMRQRVMIAMALAAEPEVVIMDEPTTALDVVVQREILSEIFDLKDRLGFSILFITHDLSLLLEIADRVVIMYAGRVVESGTREQIHRRAAHPYTKGLLTSFPKLHGPRLKLSGNPRLASRPPGRANGLPVHSALCLRHRRLRHRRHGAEPGRARSPHRVPDREHRHMSRRPSGPSRERSPAAGPSCSRQWSWQDGSSLGRGPQGDAVAAVVRSRLKLPTRNDDGAGRRERLGQDHGGAASRRPGAAARAGRPCSTGKPIEPVEQARVPRLQGSGADGLPGSVRLAQPAPHGQLPPHPCAATAPRQSGRELEPRTSSTSC